MYYDSFFKKVKIYTNKERYKRIILFILICLTVLQQMPVVKDVYYTQIRIILYIGFGFFSIISAISLNKVLKIPFIRLILLTILYSIILFFISKLTNVEVVILDLIIPFGILLSSLNTDYNKRELSKLLIWYVIFSTILGVSSIFYYGQGFTITQTYFLVGKNQIGPLLGIAIIITGVWIFDKNQINFSINNIFLKVILFSMLILSIVVIRNRSGLLAVIITLSLIILKEYNFKKTLFNFIIAQGILICLIIMLYLGVFEEFLDMFYKSVFSNYDFYNINNLSAGRIEGYKISLDFISKNLFMGKLGLDQTISIVPHNYILNKWVDFGVLGSLPFVLFYLYLYGFVILRIYNKRLRTSFSLPIWILLFSLIVSNFEYTYPYGPGVSQVMMWFLLGQYFKINHVSLSNINNKGISKCKD